VIATAAPGLLHGDAFAAQSVVVVVLAQRFSERLIPAPKNRSAEMRRDGGERSPICQTPPDDVGERCDLIAQGGRAHEGLTLTFNPTPIEVGLVDPLAQQPCQLAAL
jgi:hypothetical protein